MPKVKKEEKKVVTPNRVSDGVAGPPRKKKKYFMKDKREVTPKSLLFNDTEVKMKTLTSGISLIYFDQGGKEGFVLPLTKLFDDNLGPADAADRDELFGKTGIFAVVGRRKSRTVNEYQCSDPEKKYKRVYFLYRTLSAASQDLFSTGHLLCSHGG